MNHIMEAYKNLFYELSKNKKVYFFRAGKICKNILKRLEDDNYHIESILDNDKNLWGKTMGRYPIISLADIMALPREDIIIVITNRCYKEINKQLREVGIIYIFTYECLVYEESNIYKGNYSKWEEALNVSSGYDHKVILNKVADAFKKVSRGEAEFERDSVPFYKIQYNYFLLSALLFIASKESELSVIDFGGSLGSTYYQHRKALAHIKGLKWRIIEQKCFVDYAIKNIVPVENEIQFYYNVQEIKESKSNCLLISGSLQYLDKPYKYLQTFLDKKVKYLVVDRIPIWNLDERIVVQEVPKEIYEASYPAWILNEDDLKNYIKKYYCILWEWEDVAKVSLLDENIDIPLKGFFCELIV